MSITALGYVETLQTACLFCGPWCGLFHAMQALANAMLAVVSHEALAAQLRGHPPTFEMLRAFQVPSSIPWRCQFLGFQELCLVTDAARRSGPRVQPTAAKLARRRLAERDRMPPCVAARDCCLHTSDWRLGYQAAV